MAQCERSRLQKDGTACLNSGQPRRFLLLFLFITRNLMSLNCTAACKASWRRLGRSYQYEADFNPLHMNWALVDDTKGNPRLQMRWVVDR
jgi:hypothetical protein